MLRGQASRKTTKTELQIVQTKQPQQGDREGKSKDVELNQNETASEWKQQGKNKAKEGHYRPNGKTKENKGGGWKGPDIMGDPHGGQDMGQVRGPNQPGSRITRSSSLEGGRDSALQGVVTTRQEDPARDEGQGSATGFFKRFEAEKTGNQEMNNHMSSNRYFSLMAFGKFGDNGDGEDEDWEMNRQACGEEDGMSHILMEAEPCQGGNNLQIIEFQGGPSHPPGKDSTC